MFKKFLTFISSVSIFVMPAIAWAQTTAVQPVQKTFFHAIYEKSFGPFGAIAGFIGIIAMWNLSRKVEKDFGFLLKTFVIFIFIINIGSISFGVHGAGVIDGTTSRYIERTCRLIALLTTAIAALMLQKKLSKKNDALEAQPQKISDK